MRGGYCSDYGGDILPGPIHPAAVGDFARSTCDSGRLPYRFTDDVVLSNTESTPMYLGIQISRCVNVCLNDIEASDFNMVQFAGTQEAVSISPGLCCERNFSRYVGTQRVQPYERDADFYLHTGGFTRSSMAGILPDILGPASSTSD
mmetsp:Transcript_15521/g.45398  ORF Transcript_15521/g.45398 Transcript_15521/m.45398 type:complete len:147 (-) Transcript_15521:339-779(-)